VRAGNLYRGRHFKWLYPQNPNQFFSGFWSVLSFIHHFWPSLSFFDGLDPESDQFPDWRLSLNKNPTIERGRTSCNYFIYCLSGLVPDVILQGIHVSIKRD